MEKENQILIVVLDEKLSTDQICDRMNKIQALHGVIAVRTAETVKSAIMSVLDLEE